MSNSVWGPSYGGVSSPQSHKEDFLQMKNVKLRGTQWPPKATQPASERTDTVFQGPLMGILSLYQK